MIYLEKSRIICYGLQFENIFVNLIRRHIILKMFLLNWFGGNSNSKGKKKKGKKSKIQNILNLAKMMLNPMKEVKMYGYSKMGYGPKKTEC